MNSITLKNVVLNYQITFKNNKNTYFHFKKSGYIQINASKYQKKKDIIKFIRNNQDSFIEKYIKLTDSLDDPIGYFIWGIEYKQVKNGKINELMINKDKYIIEEPTISSDHLLNMYQKEEKEILLEEALNLKNKYINNGLIDIKNIKIKTRATTSRFGSCNYRLKTINLNLKLVHYDKKYLEYVFLHEITHLVHQNHSSDFYNLLKKIAPNYKELKKELNLKFNR